MHTPFLQMLIVLTALWLLFSVSLFAVERGDPGSPITTLIDALYWGVAALSTAGIADTPATQVAKVLGGTWIIVGSAIFFGSIVATITTYFMRPLQRPARRIIDTIEYNLEQLDELSVDELDILKETTDTLIEHVERAKERQGED